MIDVFKAMNKLDIQFCSLKPESIKICKKNLRLENYGICCEKGVYGNKNKYFKGNIKFASCDQMNFLVPTSKDNMI